VLKDDASRERNQQSMHKFATPKRRWSMGDDENIATLYGLVLKTIDTNRDAISRIQHKGAAAGASLREMRQQIVQFQAEKLELVEQRATGPPETEVQRQIRELKCDLDDCRSQLRASEVARMIKQGSLDNALARRREMQRDLNGAMGELDRLRQELHLIRPLAPQGKPVPPHAPRQDYPELEPSYSPRHAPTPPATRPSPVPSPILAKAIAMGLQRQQQQAQQQARLLGTQRVARPASAPFGRLAAQGQQRPVSPPFGRVDISTVRPHSQPGLSRAAAGRDPRLTPPGLTRRVPDSARARVSYVEAGDDVAAMSREMLEAQVRQLRRANGQLNAAVGATAAGMTPQPPASPRAGPQSPMQMQRSITPRYQT